MSGIMEVRVQVPQNKLGDLIADLQVNVPYANVVGVTPIIPSFASNKVKLSKTVQLPKLPLKPVQEATDPQPQLISKPQKRMINAIKEGINTLPLLTEALGIPPWSVARVLNVLKNKKRLVKVHNGVYTVLDKA